MADLSRRPRARAIQVSTDVDRLVSAAKGRVAARPAIRPGKAADAIQRHADAVMAGKVTKAPLGRGRSALS